MSAYYKLIVPFDMPLMVYKKGEPVFRTLPKGEYKLVDVPNPADPTLTPWLIVPEFNLGMSGAAWFTNRNEKDMPFYGMSLERVDI